MPAVASLGERMKFYEEVFGGVTQLMPLIPVVVRLDGRGFHNFTKGLRKPFDYNLIDLMIKTTEFLVEETNACVGYTQSDEISLILYTEDFNSQIYFDGRVAKINSVLAATCSSYFTSKLPEAIPSKVGCNPVFDCRCFNVPTKMEAVNALVWREQDATRNSVQMVGQANFSHNELQNKSCSDIQEMLHSKYNINWNNFHPKCKRGTYVQRRKVLKKFSKEELEKLPEKHEARSCPDLVFSRSEIRTLDMPPITKVVNVRDVIFDGEDPKVLES
jgi:tRNA(His) 5'-end guanylyltransferase